MEIFWTIISWEGEVGKWGESAWIKKHNWWEENRQGDVENSVGNGEAKECLYASHGHELMGALLERRRVPGREGQMGKMGQL